MLPDSIEIVPLPGGLFSVTLLFGYGIRLITTMNGAELIEMSKKLAHAEE